MEAPPGGANGSFVGCPVRCGNTALTASGSQVIKLQCKSGDTAVFTVNFGGMLVQLVY